MVIGWQVILRLLDDRVIAPTPAKRRVFADTVLRVGRRRRVFVFDAPDTHCHVAAHCDEAQAGRLAQDLVAALQPALGHPVPFRAPILRAIKDQWHLENMLDYVLGQRQHHGVGGDRLLESTNLPDLLGLRVTGAWTAGLVRKILPRVDRARLLRLLGVDEVEEGWDLALLGESAASAAGLADLGPRTPRHVEARVAAVHVAIDAGCSAGLIAQTLGVSVRGVRALRARPALPALERAIRLQMGLRLRLGAEQVLFLRDGGATYNVEPVGRPHWERAGGDRVSPMGLPPVRYTGVQPGPPPIP